MSVKVIGGFEAKDPKTAKKIIKSIIELGGVIRDYRDLPRIHAESILEDVIKLHEDNKITFPEMMKEIVRLQDCFDLDERSIKKMLLKHLDPARKALRGMVNIENNSSNDLIERVLRRNK